MHANPRQTDTLFGLFIRERDRKCVFKIKCGGSSKIIRLDPCHFLSKGSSSEAVRFHPDNADAGCDLCHEFIDHTADGIIWHREFKLKQLGETKYWELVRLANSYKKRNDKQDKIDIKNLFETIN